MNFCVISTNIRFDNPKDGKHDWKGRMPVLRELLAPYNADLVGTQEGRRPQLLELKSVFPKLRLVSSHREWIEERMYPCILFNPHKIALVNSGDIWLSETPEIAGSKSFDSAFPRLCTWIHGKFIENDQEFIFVNTHLDHMLSETRDQQSKVLIKEISKINKNNLPLIITGDFNEEPSGKVRANIMNSDLKVIDNWNKEETHSFHKFDGKNESPSRIDWILTDEKFQCESIKLETGHLNNIYPSDHFPVIGHYKL